MEVNNRYWLKRLLISHLAAGVLFSSLCGTVFAHPQQLTEPDTVVVTLSEEEQRPLPPQTKKLSVLVKGVQEEREAALFESALGYYLYVLPQFVASGEEPGKDIVFSKVDDRFSMRIEKLGTTVDQKKLRQLAEIELGDIGKITEEKRPQDPFWNQTVLYLTASNPQTIKDVIVFQVDGSWFKVTRFMVNNKQSKEFESSMTAMLQTIRLK